jgi:[ribosomal protein S5]-alanine N-acetyltransferase
MADTFALPVLATDRLILRSPQLTDAQDIFFLRSDATVNKYLKGFSHETIEQTLAFLGNIIKGIAGNGSPFWIITLQDGTFIGTICLWNISQEARKADVGYTLLPTHVGNGYMQEALNVVIDYGFNHMKLATIEAYTHADNVRSANLLARCNFKYDATKKTENSTDIAFVRQCP